MPKPKTPTTPRGKLLRRVRQFLKHSQYEMARAMRCDKATISQWETGRLFLQDVRLDTLLFLVMEAEHDATETPKLLAAIRKERIAA